MTQLILIEKIICYLTNLFFKTFITHMKKFDPKIIAYYLPQFHPMPENDEWWGKGFTEWTNVGKAKPLYRGHDQPKVPADLGYYDLRIPEIRSKQAELAKEAGVYGFCYWHYWFGNGRQLLNGIIDEVIASGEPDFPFCFGWANESWKSKLWQKDATKDKLLMEQVYGGENDYKEHFEYALKAFTDKRYILVEGKPLFLIFQPQHIPDDFIDSWNNLAKNAGFENGLHFIARLTHETDINIVRQKGFEYFTSERWQAGYRFGTNFYKVWIRLKSRALRNMKSAVLDYEKSIPYFTNEKEDSQENYYPALIPNWDHSPRSGRRAIVLTKALPKYFYLHAIKVLNIIKKKNNQIVFLKSWNEWGEGNYMEPDLKHGKGHINALAKAIKDVGEQK